MHWNTSTESGIVHLSGLGGEAQASIRGNCISGTSLPIRTWAGEAHASIQPHPQKQEWSTYQDMGGEAQASIQSIHRVGNGPLIGT